MELQGLTGNVSHLHEFGGLRMLSCGAGSALPYSVQILPRKRLLLERAVEFDPGYARAHAALANFYRLELGFDRRGSDACLDHPFVLAQRAVFGMV